MTRRTRLLLLFGLPAGLTVLAVGVWLLWPRTAITPENAAKIQVGMPLPEVEAILGGPQRLEGSASFASLAGAEPLAVSPHDICEPSGHPERRTAALTWGPTTRWLWCGSTERTASARLTPGALSAPTKAPSTASAAGSGCRTARFSLALRPGVVPNGRRPRGVGPAGGDCIRPPLPS
jgi:hypothetical protein